MTGTKTQTETTTTPAPSHSAPKQHGASASGDPKCAPKDLGIHFRRAQGGLGHEFAQFQFINVSPHRCHLIGAPGMAAYGRGGRRLPVTVQREKAPTGSKRKVELAPRGRAEFKLQTTPSVKHCETAHHLRFTPPNDRSTLGIRYRVKICGAGFPVFVTAVYKPR